MYIEYLQKFLNHFHIIFSFSSPEHKLKLQTTSLKPVIGVWPNSTGMIPGWSPTNFVQMVLIGNTNRSRDQTLGFQHTIFKNPIVWNYKAQSFDIWCITSSRGHLAIFCEKTLVVLCKWLHCDIWPFPQVSDPGIKGPSGLLCVLVKAAVLQMLKK